LKKGSVLVWEVATGKETTRIDAGDDYVGSLAFSPSGDRLAGVHHVPRPIDFWDAATGKFLGKLSTGSGILRAVAYSPDGLYLATGGSSGLYPDKRGEVKIWDRRTGREIHLLRGHGDWVMDVAFGADGQRLASVDREGMLKVWDVPTGQACLTFAGNVRTFNAPLSIDNKQIVGARISVAGLNDLFYEAMAGTAPAGTLHAVTFSPDGSKLATADDTGINVYDGQPYPELVVLKPRAMGGDVWTLTTDDRRCLIVKDEEGTVRGWDGRTGKTLFTLPIEARTTPYVAVHVDRRRLAYSSGRAVKTIDLETGKPARTFETGEFEVMYPAYSSDGRLLAGLNMTQGPARGRARVRVVLWDTETGAQRHRFDKVIDPGRGLQFGRDVRRLGIQLQAGKGYRTYDLTGAGPVEVDESSPRTRELAWEGEDRAIDEMEETRILDLRPTLKRGDFRAALLRPDPQWHLSQAVNAAGSRQFGAFLFHFCKVLQLRDKVPAAYIAAGDALHRKRRFQEAEAEFKKALLLDPDDPHAHYGLGLALGIQDRLDEAEAEFQTVIRLDPANYRPYTTLGALYVECGRFEEAKAVFRKAIQVDPENALSHYHLGNALAQQGRLEEAQAAFRKAIQLEPRLARAHSDLGESLKRQGRLADAQAEFHKAAELGDKEAAQQALRCGRLLTLARRLPAVLKGEDRPASASERLEFAELCVFSAEKRYSVKL
jgi:Flp pilus assembly protein TadD/WD40 repeat protein